MLEAFKYIALLKTALKFDVCMRQANLDRDHQIGHSYFISLCAIDYLYSGQ